MAINFSQVKKITIPEGSVKKITDSAGNILWKEQPNNWHTIWEGNKTCSIELKNNGNPVIIGDENDEFAKTAIGTGYKPKIRITFSYSINPKSIYGFNNYVYINGDPESDVQSSPITINELYDSYGAMTVLGPLVEKSDDTYKYARASLRRIRDTENNRIIFYLQATQHGLASGNYINYLKLTLTVTKIEQYYE